MIELKPCPFCGGKAVLSGKYTIQGVDVDACSVLRDHPERLFCGAQIFGRNFSGR